MRLRKLGKFFQLSRNEDQLGRFERLEKAVDAFEHATRGTI